MTDAFRCNGCGEYYDAQLRFVDASMHTDVTDYVPLTLDEIPTAGYGVLEDGDSDFCIDCGMSVLNDLIARFDDNAARDTGVLHWEEQATRNIQKWGLQSEVDLAAAITEELGELLDALLPERDAFEIGPRDSNHAALWEGLQSARDNGLLVQRSLDEVASPDDALPLPEIEDVDEAALREELDDLAALCIQLHRHLDTSIDSESPASTAPDPSSVCTKHRQTLADNSGRGEHYSDDRTRLAHVYSGTTLKATVFDEREVQRYREETAYTVSLTPAGECRIEDRCRTHPDVEET